ncbi:uncharacterized protein B0H18DRAFT_1104924 [Fomitopsis serialis]|uniref:uncharacterized protein n=1 Tax=Fomitopsis serialis TaxID=139415 RepID=UPI0020087252|nr:uncharacterized protein B0H18DRAFT_1104924 [Neoantrodia serialis]KAH9924781.1 hypothetical protein B0H18DRAFT_1104924 [Neoantrodia serialis]
MPPPAERRGFGRIPDTFSRAAVQQGTAEYLSSSPAQVTSKNPRLFALVIGIDDYHPAVGRLKGAVADADSVEDFLKQDLKVPQDQIKNLRDAQATRKSILEALIQLQGHPRHGGLTATPPGWEAGSTEIQQLIPCDWNVMSGENQTLIHGIPDRTVAVLLNRLAEAKGDNITVIFVCCHSASGTRKAGSGLVSRSVTFPPGYETPVDLDQDILRRTPGAARAVQIPKGFLSNGLRSHVLLAACGAWELAFEDPKTSRGIFTEALLEAIRANGVEKLSYHEVLYRIPPLSVQTPQCEGYNQDRMFFDGKAPSARRVLFEVRRDEDKDRYRIQAGAAQGITEGAEFSVYQDRATVGTGTPLGVLRVNKVRAFVSIAKVLPGASVFSLSDPAFALQTKVGLAEDLRVYAAQSPTLATLLDAVDRRMQDSDYHGRKITYASNKDQAELGMSIEDGLVVFDILDPRVTQYGLTRLPHTASTDADEVFPIICAAADYFWHLRRRNTKPERIVTGVTLDIRKLNSARRSSDDSDSDSDSDVPLAWKPENTNLNENGILELLLDKPIDIGYRLENNAQQPLYPYLFYFNCNDLSVGSLNVTASAGRFQPDRPLLVGGSLTIGYDASGSYRTVFKLEKGRDLEPACRLLFRGAEVAFRCEEPNWGMVKPDLPEPPIWDTVFVTVVQRRGTKTLKPSAEKPAPNLPTPAANFLFATQRRLEELCAQFKDGSRVYDYGGEGYKSSVRHFLDSSADVAAFAVQPGSEESLSKIIQVLAADKAPFAVKGGGHAMNPGFSSTTGVQISMARFDQVRFDSSSNTLAVGAGCLWDEVYRKVSDYGRNVVGGAASEGVGVAGWLLGGGYSMKTNKYGIGIDNVVQYRIVLPDGKICVATKNNEYTDLFQALRGGGNNFGIVTEFTLRTHPQTGTYGAALSFPGTQEEKVKAAIVQHVTNEKRPEAAIVAAFRHTLLHGEPEYKMSVFCVFDAPEPDLRSEVPFQAFADIMREYNPWKADPAGWGTTRSGGRAVRRGSSNREDESNESYGFRAMSYAEVHQLASFPYDLETDLELPVETLSRTGARRAAGDSVSFVGRPSSQSPSALPRTVRQAQGGRAVKKAMLGVGEKNARGRFACIMVSKYTKKLVDAVADEAREAAKSLRVKNGLLVLIDVWPFLPTIFDNSPSGAAWPHKKGEAFGPLLAYFLWEKAEDDDFWLGKMKTALKNIREVALAEGCTTLKAPYYSNTSLEDITPRMIYRGNLRKLGKVRAKYDPNDVMGQTGGFKIPLADNSA